MRTEQLAVVVVAFFVAAAIVFGLEVWLVMLCLGAAHAQEAVVPALGFWGTAWVVAAANLVLASTNGRVAFHRD